MRILTVVNNENPQAIDASMLLAAYFASQGIENQVVSAPNVPTPEQLASGSLQDAGIEPFDMAVALGGDGTILRTARAAIMCDAPVMGINFGHLGFLANPCEPGVIPLVAAALAGDVTEDRRTNLLVEVVCEGDEETDLEERGLRMFTALNEVTITRGSCPRNLETQVDISGDTVCTLRGDGVIVATATGSTAYALSAGGPLISPSMRGMVVVPLATHTLQSRAIVADHNDVVETSFDFAEGYTFAEVQLDGTALSFATPIERVIVRCSDEPARLLFYKKESFYSRIARTFF